jgi:hypothetical protein
MRSFLEHTEEQYETLRHYPHDELHADVRRAAAKLGHDAEADGMVSQNRVYDNGNGRPHDEKVHRAMKRLGFEKDGDHDYGTFGYFRDVTFSHPNGCSVEHTNVGSTSVILFKHPEMVNVASLRSP